MTAEILAVVILCRVELRSRYHLRDNRDRKHLRRFKRLNFGLGTFVLLTGMNVNNRAVLRTDIVPLAIECRRIVNHKKNVQQIFIRNQCGIKAQANNFSMPGFAATD